MAGVYSKRFLVAGNAGANVSVQVPATKLWVIKFAQLIHDSTGSGEAAVIEGPGTVVLATSSAPIYTGSIISRFEGMTVMYALETLTLVVFSGRWDAVVAGYEFAA